jgi:transcriptional regulator with XRE-family HTH domain
MINEKLEENIRIFITIKGYSQEGLANKLGKSQNWLQNIEKGEIDIPLSCLSLITNELGITLDLLLTFDPKLLLNSNIKMETLMDKNNSEQLLTEISQLLQKIEKKL